MQFHRVALGAAADRLDAVARFYSDRLGFGVEREEGRVRVAGATGMEFVAASGAPFTHFAFLVPGDRFRAALAWARERVPLLPSPHTGEPVFEFGFWDAEACYFEDPAGNVVELIGHRGIAETGGRGFAAGDLCGLSELGLVVRDRPAAGAQITARLGLTCWDGALDGAGLAFVGERARTLILAPAGRAWLPTERPAAACPTSAALATPRQGTVQLPDGPVRLEGTR